MQLFILYFRENNPSSSKLCVLIIHKEIEHEINFVENFMGT